MTVVDGVGLRKDVGERVRRGKRGNNECHSTVLRIYDSFGSANDNSCILNGAAGGSDCMS